MSPLDLGWELFSIEGLEYWGKLSFLKAGINFSDIVTTVSAKYASEIQTPEFGFGFDGILRRRADRLVGIPNGIDVDVWDPGRDPNLPEAFGPDKLEAKAASKRALLEAFGLPADGATLARPIVGMVSRLVDQKGFDLLAEVSDELLQLDATYVLLGSGERRYEQLWQRLAARVPDRVAVRIGFDERLAHLIEAGSDIFLMPSRFEPCGLNQMYSLRYGTVPVVRATGGLDDTIVNWSRKTGRGNGFKFSEPTPSALLGALEQALAVYRDPAAWRALQLDGMARDFSWEASARQYGKVYEKAIRLARTR
jgi:starch synthase